MSDYEVATHTISGIKLPKIFKCPVCNRTCHLLRDDTGIYVSGSTIKKHLCSNNPPRQWLSWECYLMNLLDYRLWFCDCHYQAPYGRVTIGGCAKHD